MVKRKEGRVGTEGNESISGNEAKARVERVKEGTNGRGGGA